VEKHENVFPMIPSGKAPHDMMLAVPVRMGVIDAKGSVLVKRGRHKQTHRRRPRADIEYSYKDTCHVSPKDKRRHSIQLTTCRPNFRNVIAGTRLRFLVETNPAWLARVIVFSRPRFKHRQPHRVQSGSYRSPEPHHDRHLGDTAGPSNRFKAQLGSDCTGT